MNLAILLLLGLGQAPVTTPFASPVAWHPRFQGVDLAELRTEKPRLMRGHAVRIDLRTKGLSFLATPSNGKRPGDSDGLKTSSFLKKYGCQIAINGAPFSPIHKEEGKAQTIAGLTISRGELVSRDRNGRPALLITRDNKVTISNPPFQLDHIHNALGGFQIVLEKGRILNGNASIHPRTAAGISADGRTLYLLVIDGRQKDYSVGATTEEVGQWLKALGASDGINLDGGGTTTLVVQDREGNPVIVNRPIHGNKPGQERVSASHLGIFVPGPK